MLMDASTVPQEEQSTKVDLTFTRIRRLSSSNAKWKLSKFILIALCLLGIYLFLLPKARRQETSTSTSTRRPRGVQTHGHAFIITADCNSDRFNGTKENIERVFPTFFTIHCHQNTPFNDSRIHSSSELLFKKYSSNQLAFIDLWTNVIPNYSVEDDLQWSFIFEDDVIFNAPGKVSLLNYTSALQEMMFNSELQSKDGFMYLGICGPKFDNDTQVLVSSETNNTMISQRGYGFCMHASGITARKSRLFWAEIASYRPNALDSSLDLQVRDYLIRSGNHYYTVGSNFLYPPGTGHYGIAYQDRGRFSTTVA